MLFLAYRMPILQPKFNELSVEQVKYERKQKTLVYFKFRLLNFQIQMTGSLILPYFES